MEELVGKLCRWKTGDKSLCLHWDDSGMCYVQADYKSLNKEAVLLPVKSFLIFDETDSTYKECYEVLLTDVVEQTSYTLDVLGEWLELANFNHDYLS